MELDVFTQKQNGVEIGLGSTARRPTANVWFENDVLKVFSMTPQTPHLCASTKYAPMPEIERPVNASKAFEAWKAAQHSAT